MSSSVAPLAECQRDEPPHGHVVVASPSRATFCLTCIQPGPCGLHLHPEHSLPSRQPPSSPAEGPNSAGLGWSFSAASRLLSSRYSIRT